MTKLYVKLQTPTVELAINAKDSSGAKDNIIVGFKRYEANESTTQLTSLGKLFLEQSEKEVTEIDTTDLDIFIKSQIVYIRQAHLLLIDEDDKKTALDVMDTRKAKPVADRWETPEECLDALLDLYLASAPWRSALNIGLRKALTNAEFDEDALKNL